MKLNVGSSLSNPRLLIGLFLLSAFLTIIGLGAPKGSDERKQSKGSLQLPAPAANARSQSKGVTSRNNPYHYADANGSRASGTKSGPALIRNDRRSRPRGNGAWSSLGPPGGDVFD